jgi:hypothetical protein
MHGGRRRRCANYFAETKDELMSSFPHGWKDKDAPRKWRRKTRKKSISAFTLYGDW